MTETSRTNRLRLADLWPGTSAPPGELPPGQRALGVFPRYGTHFGRPIPDIEAVTSIAVRGSVTEPVEVPVARLATMRRRDMVADFHCVAGWSVKGVRWGGVRFRDLFDEVLAPLAVGKVTHVRFVGVDGFRSVLVLEDAFQDDVMLADHLDDEPLGGEHGGPVRVVSPSQYGYKNTKHLRTIELHTSEPAEGHARFLTDLGLWFVKPHPRARVAYEERHRVLPGRSVRWVNFNVIHPIVSWLLVRGEAARSGGRVLR